MAYQIEIDKQTNFPSDFISPEQKATPEYAIKCAEAMDTIGINGSGNGFFPGFHENSQISKFDIWEAYAMACQPIDKYKPILGIKNKTRNDPNATSYRALNWEIMDVATKFVNLLQGKLIKQSNDVGVKAVDKYAQDARRKKKMEMQNYVINKPLYDSVTAKTGIEFESPVQDGVIPPPQNLGEIDMFMEMFYKEDFCIIVQDMLKEINEEDNYQDILFEIAWDFVTKGLGATKTYRVRNKIVRRKCNVKRMGVSSSSKANFEDAKWTYEDWDLTIGQYKEIAGSQFTEAQYKDIAEKASNRSFNDVNANDYYQKNMCYPWDNTKITVKDCVWFSPDWITEQVGENQFGEVVVNQKPYEWWKKLEEKGVTEKQFNEVNTSKVIRYSLDNQYQCLWVKGTKYVSNYGKSKDMLKNESSMGKTVSPFSIYKLKKCPMEVAMPTFDWIQINWMQMQHQAARSVPAGQAIEIGALMDVSLDGKGGKQMKPKEILQLYFETGIQLWKRRDGAGNQVNGKPIEALANGISNAMEKHWSAMLGGIDLLKVQFALNDLTDASTPNSEMGKAVALMASGGTDDGLRPLNFALDQINLATHKRTVMHISGMAATGLAPQYTEAIGLRNMSVLALLSDLTMHELGVYLEKQPTDEMNAWYAKFCETEISTGTMYSEEAIEILGEPNMGKRVRLLKMYRKQKQDKTMADQQMLAKDKSQNDIAASQAAAQASQATAQLTNDFAIMLAQETGKVTMAVNKQKTADEAFLLGLQSKMALGQAFTEEEQRRITELQKIDRKGSWDLQITKAKPKPKPAASKK